MIEKLPFTEIHTGSEDMVDRVELRPVAPYEMQHKINELVDAVNELQKDRFVVDIDKTNPISKYYDMCEPEKPQKETFVSIDEALKMGKKVDPYAEQRKWEGKLCWFWDEYPEDKIVDVLSCIDISDKYPYVAHQVHYKHCEPVKPDDDIIYKGGDNE